MKKKLLLILIMTMVLSIFSQVSAQVNDIKGHWGEDNIRYLLDKGIVQGSNNKYRPNDSITRAEFVTIINKAKNFTRLGKVKFNDVKESAWYYKEIAKAVYAGYVSGTSKTTFGPEDKISRQDAATLIGRAFAFNEVTSPSSRFRDDKSISSHAKGYVYALSQKKYINGYDDNTFRPLKSISRAEAATMIANTLKGENGKKVAITGIENLGDNQIKVSGTGKLNYTTMTLTNPDRIVFDFKDAKLLNSGGKINLPDSDNIKEVRFYEHPNYTSYVRRI